MTSRFFIPVEVEAPEGWAITLVDGKKFTLEPIASDRNKLFLEVLHALQGAKIRPDLQERIVKQLWVPTSPQVTALDSSQA